MRVGSLFSGIGGLDLGLERAGMEIVWQSEIDLYASAVLRKHWPNVPNLGDIRGIRGPLADSKRGGWDGGAREQGGEAQRGNASGRYGGQVDLICGGFPCQPFSVAGKRGGAQDDRYLWPEMLRVVKEFRPRWFLGENVPGIINMALDTVLSDLEALGYETGAVVIPACALDAPHRRDRVWILAHDKGKGLQEWKREQAAGWPCTRSPGGGLRALQEKALPNHGCGSGEGAGRECEPGRDAACWDPEPDVGRVAHEVPSRVDRLKCLGNAVVPQVAEAIGRMIVAVEAGAQPSLFA
jgi:DNA (cytosine-5)-methyltransferase 1